MKIQSLAVIFIIIVLPISLVLTSFVQSQIKTVSLQIEYDTKLDNATYDALKAFQLNTINSDTSDETDSKMRDIEASVNSFFHSIASNFNMVGYNKEILKEYVPAIVYTMYDGYYIYSPYNNKIDGIYPPDADLSKMTYKDGEKISGLKPYIFYSCRYKKGTRDIIITYSLDNYITIQGTIDGKAVNDAGYLINTNNIDTSGGNVKYRGSTILKEILKENFRNLNTELIYHKINGVKKYQNPNNNKWFTVLNNQMLNATAESIEDDSAIRYYKEAKAFSERVQGYFPDGLSTKDAVFEDGEKIKDGKTIAEKLQWSEYNILKFDNNGVSIEEDNSDFNQHRLAVIRYSIEKNLSIAIANYNTYSGLKTDFKMPKLKEEDWNQILKNISIISFLQGLNIGGKVYNGYSIINNTKNKEVVNEDSIYLTYYNEYFSPLDNRFNRIAVTNPANLKGALNIDFERKEYYTNLGERRYFFPKKELASYSSIVTKNDVYDLEKNNTNIYDYMESLANDGKSYISSAYFTALGRERQSKYRPNVYK